MNAVLTRGLTYVTAPVQTAVVTVASAAAVLAGPAAAAVAGGLLLGLVLPGLALTAIIFRHRTLSAVERTVLAPALSLAVLVVSGLLLHVADFRLDRVSWTLAAAGATLAALALAAVPERVWQGEEPEYEYEYVDEEDLPEPRDAVTVGAETVRIPLPGTAEAATELIPVIRDAPRVRQPRVLPGPFAPWSPEQKVRRGQLARQLLPMVVVLAVLAGAGYLSFVSSYSSYDVTVTVLSAGPPGPVDAAGDRVVEVTASGLVADDAPYTLAVSDGTGTRLLERPVAVDGDGTWTAALTLPAEDRLTVGLFRAGDTNPYRTLILAAVD
jgi:hypothetical protein